MTVQVAGRRATLDDREPTLRGWRTVEQRADGSKYRRGNVTVIRSLAVEDDGRPWLHVSVSLPAKVPPYALLCEVHRTFIGRDRKAVQVFAPAGEHVDLHPYCLHLWSCLDGDVLPDFTRGGASI